MSEISKESARAAGMCPGCGNVACICPGKVAELPPVRERAEQEKVERDERVERLMVLTERLFPGEAQERLRRQIRSSLDVPQWGKYHNEGMYMDTHLDVIRETIEQMYARELPPGVPEEMREIIAPVLETDKDDLLRYALLHDLEKQNSLRLKRKDGTQEDITQEQWQARLPEGLAAEPDPVALEEFLRQSDIESISYFHEGGKHGAAGADTLEDMEGVELSPLMLTAIRNHEVAFQFGGVSAKTYEKFLGDLSEKERAWVITVSFLDQAGSFYTDDPERTPSRQNFDALPNVLDSKHNFDVVQELQGLLGTDDQVQKWKVKKNRIKGDLDKLMGEKERFDMSTSDLLDKLKEGYAPKLLPGKMVGRFIGELKKLQLGSAFNEARMAALGLKAGAERADVEAVFAELDIDDEKKSALVDWIDKQVLGG